MLSFFSHIFVQDKASEELLNNIGFKNVTVVPDSRIDRVYQIYQDIQQDKLDILEKFKNNEIILIVGSSYQTEEKFINKYLESGEFNGKVILVPHNIDKNHIKKITETFGNQAVFYSELEDKNSEIRSNILVIDKIGLLAIAYQYADIAFIGGGFNNGIHNILEPAVFGLPIIFGPKDIDKFKEARDLTQMGGAFIVKSYLDFEKKLDFLLDKNNRVISGKICKDYIFENKGGSEKVIESLETFL